MSEGLPLCLATKYFDRLRGLFAYSGQEVLLAIVPCRSIHTCGFKESINVAFIDKKGCVISSYNNVSPWSFLHEIKAYGVIESWSDKSNGWYEKGDRVVLNKIEPG